MRTMQPEVASVPTKELVKLGYKTQCLPILQQLRHLIATWHAAGESAIVEGVHLNVKPVLQLMQRFSSVMPFLVRSLPA
jgi:2-phosphoglycerate kinase